MPIRNDKKEMQRTSSITNTSGTLETIEKTSLIEETRTLSSDGFDLLANRKVTYTDEYGQNTEGSYDSDQRTAKVTSPLHSAQIAYNDRDLVKDVNFDNDYVNVEYDVDKIKTIYTTTGNMVNSTEYEYDGYGRVSEIARSNGDSMILKRDSRGFISNIFTPDNSRSIDLYHDNNGNLKSIDLDGDNPGTMRHRFDYSVTNEPVKYRPPMVEVDDELIETNTWSKYNYDGQLTQITRPDGSSFEIVYDDTTGKYLDTLYKPSDSDPQVTLVSSNYYETGTKDLESMTYGDETLSYTWYEDGLKKTETWTGTVEGTIKWDYDSYRKPEQITVGTEAPVTYGYDEFQRITTVGALGFEYYETELTNLTPDSGKLALVTLDESDVNYYYDDKGLPFETTYTQSGVEKFRLSYTRDDRDRLSSITEVDNEITTVKQYRYDDSGRLWRVENADGNALVTYKYDINGNRTRHYTATRDAHYTYNGQDQLTAMSGTDDGTGFAYAYTYTPNGELKTKASSAGVTTYDYDEFGNLSQVTLPNTTVIGYTYDAQNRRIAKKVNDTVTERFIYKDQLEPVAKLDGDGNILEQYVYGETSHTPGYIIKNGTTYRVISDHLGSVRKVVDSATGTVAQEITYDEFGNVLTDSNPGFQPFYYVGGIYDRDTKLVKFGARDYDPETGRWTSKEPLGFEGSLNFYVYCDADPVNFVDVTGLFKTKNYNKAVNYAKSLLEQHLKEGEDTNPEHPNLKRELGITLFKDLETKEFFTSDIYYGNWFDPKKDVSAGIVFKVKSLFHDGIAVDAFHSHIKNDYFTEADLSAGHVNSMRVWLYLGKWRFRDTIHNPWQYIRLTGREIPYVKKE